MPREWDTPLREPWNPVIHRLLKAIDTHMSLYLETGDSWHFRKAQILREYVVDLKDWISAQEGRLPEPK